MHTRHACHRHCGNADPDAIDFPGIAKSRSLLVRAPLSDDPKLPIQPRLLARVDVGVAVQQPAANDKAPFALPVRVERVV
jgi:hypothetical protein